MTEMKRLITLTYDAEVDCAYLYLVPPTPGCVAASLPVTLNDEGVAGSLVIDRDVLNRIVGIEVIGAAGILPPHLYLDEEDDVLPPKSLMRRIRFLTERAAIAECLTNILETHTRTGVPIVDLIRSELRDRKR